MSETKREAIERLDDIHEHGIRTHHEASEGFDYSEPQTPKIWAFTIGSVIILVVVIIALQQYFEKIWNDAVYQKVLEPPSQELQDLRNRDSWALTHYGYEDKSKGQVRIPLDRARELFLKEAAEGKTFYPAKPTLPKSDADEKSPAPLPTPNQQ
ncbi:MAG TPA: hypothetical protein VGG72_17830 [Bryobacteraceae bacterium]|jgi:hypothetical protein